MAEQQNILIIFTDKSDQVLSEIMRKYQVEESLEKMAKNIMEDKPNNIVVLNELTANFAKGEISEKDLVDSIQKDIGASQQIATDISKEIITNLVPTLKKMSEEEIAKLNKELSQTADQTKKDELSAIPKMRAPIEVEKILAERQGQPVKERIKGPPRKKSPAMPEEAEKPIARQPRKPDVYREPIE